MTEAPCERRRRPPRWLAVLAMSLGAALLVLTYTALASQAPAWLAPALIGRGRYGSFLGGLTVAPSLLGWLLLFWPGFLANVPLGLLGGTALLVLLVLLGYGVRDLTLIFLDGRRGSGPG